MSTVPFPFSSSTSSSSSSSVLALSIGKVQLEAKLGEGTYGTVYRAQFLPAKAPLKRVQVAVKLISYSKFNKKGKDLISTEIEIIRSLKHTNIVALVDFAMDALNVYILMEYCNGGDLAELIHRKRLLPESYARFMVRQMGCAMSYLRQRNISHLDLKPQNMLLLTRPPKLPLLKIADFGFAQYLTNDDIHSTVRGSPLYMAPEMLLYNKYDAKADLWSIGVILFEMLYGAPPFSADNIADLFKQMQTMDCIPLPGKPSVSADCAELLSGLLTKDPVSRIPFFSFFDHPFVDVKHFPSPECLPKAIEIAKEATMLDSSGKYSEAFQKYREAVQFLIGARDYTDEDTVKQGVSAKAMQYLDRAETLKSKIHLDKTKLSVVTSSVVHPPQYEPLPFQNELFTAERFLNDAKLSQNKQKFWDAHQAYQIALENYFNVLNNYKLEPPLKQQISETVAAAMKVYEEIGMYLEMNKPPKTRSIIDMIKDSLMGESCGNKQGDPANALGPRAINPNQQLKNENSSSPSKHPVIPPLSSSPTMNIGDPVSPSREERRRDREIAREERRREKERESPKEHRRRSGGSPKDERRGGGRASPREGRHRKDMEIPPLPTSDPGSLPPKSQPTEPGPFTKFLNFFRQDSNPSQPPPEAQYERHPLSSTRPTSGSQKRDPPDLIDLTGSDHDDDDDDDDDPSLVIVTPPKQLSPGPPSQRRGILSIEPQGAPPNNTVPSSSNMTSGPEFYSPTLHPLPPPFSPSLFSIPPNLDHDAV